MFTFPTQKLGTKGMEGASKGEVGRRREKFLDSSSHLACCLVGEGEKEKILRVKISFPNQIDCSVG